MVNFCIKNMNSKSYNEFKDKLIWVVDFCKLIWREILFLHLKTNLKKIIIILLIWYIYIYIYIYSSLLQFLNLTQSSMLYRCELEIFNYIWLEEDVKLVVLKKWWSLALPLILLYLSIIGDNLTRLLKYVRLKAKEPGT